MMMNVTYHCPGCEQTVRQELNEATKSLVCPNCKQRLRIPRDAVLNNTVRRCVACPSTDLYVRKDFPQRLGVAIVVLGFVASTVAWYGYHVYWTFGLLFATALIDVVLYAIVGEGLMCYRCGAMYRGFEPSDGQGRFDLETHERHRQQADRLKRLQRAAESRDQQPVKPIS